MTRQRRRKTARRKARRAATIEKVRGRRPDHDAGPDVLTHKEKRKYFAHVNVVQAEQPELDFRHAGWSTRRTKIRAAMVAAGYTGRRLESFDNCGAAAWVYADEETGELVLQASYCKDRWCQPCARARSLLIADNLKKKIEHDRHLHIVLTTKHVDAPLPDQVDRIFRNFKKLRDTRLWKNAVDGGATFLQAHVSKRDGLWHVHFHTIARGKWLDQRELSAAWYTITGDSTDTHVSSVDDVDAAVREVARYAAKPVDGDTTDDPDRLAELMRSLAGRHLCFTWGRWRGFKLTKPPDRDAPRKLKQLGRLVDFIARAQAGEVHAATVLDVLRRRSSPPTGPPVTSSLQLQIFDNPRPTLTPTPPTSTTPPDRTLQPWSAFCR